MFTTIWLEIVVAGAALAVLLRAAWKPAGDPRPLGYSLAAGLALLALASFTLEPSQGTLLGGLYRDDSLSLWGKRVLLLLAPFAFLLAAEYAPRLPHHAEEFFAVLLLALSGMLVLVAANDLILLFVSMELVTVSFYVLNSWQRKSRETLEAATKYLILGALATGLIVYGIAYLCGSTGATRFEAVAAGIVRMDTPSLALKLGVLFLLAGFTFKLAAVPGHMWAPDVYQAAPTPVAAALASASKVAGVVALLRLLQTALWPLHAFWLPVICVLAAASLLYGAFGALQQTNFKRLLGYSAIAHAGFLLMGVAGLRGESGQTGTSVVFFYVTQYAFSNLCLFVVAELLSRNGARVVDLHTAGGLRKQSGILLVALTAGLLSLAGVPPLSGFMGKLLLFFSALGNAPAGVLVLLVVFIAMLSAVVALFYYFRFLRAAWSDGDPAALPVKVPPTLLWTLALLTLALLWLGLWPAPLLQAL